jgi:hypothetical protein
MIFKWRKKRDSIENLKQELKKTKNEQDRKVILLQIKLLEQIKKGNIYKI